MFYRLIISFVVGNELVVPRLSNPAKNNVLSADSERATVEPSTGKICTDTVVYCMLYDTRMIKKLKIKKQVGIEVTKSKGTRNKILE